MHSPKHREEQAQTLREHAARLAFPDWNPEPDDWTNLHTGFQDGAPCTEVAVYRDTDRIHYRRYTGDDLRPFWRRLMNAHAE